MGSRKDEVERLSALLFEKDDEIARASATVYALTTRIAPGHRLEPISNSGYVNGDDVS
jgi:hypothetical protein